MGRYFTFHGGVDSIRSLGPIMLATGDLVAPRDLKTYEIRDALIEVNDPTRPTMLGIGRRWSKAVAVAEFLQLVGGFSEPEVMSEISPFFNQVKNGGALHGAYGPRLSMQMPAVIQRLRDDPDTRQAVACIWDPLHDVMQEGRRDLPCTIDLTFAVRKKKLLMSTHMRSNDVWKGWSYDLFQFTQLQCTIANILRLDPGPYTHFANSLHLYASDADAAMALTPPSEEQPALRGIYASSWAAAQRVATDIWLGEHDDPTNTEEWMMEVAKRWHRE